MPGLARRKLRLELRRRLSTRVWRIGIDAFLVAVAVTCLFPLVWMVSSSLKDQGRVYTDMSLFPRPALWSNYVKAWTDADLGVYLFNSGLYLVVVVVGVLLVGSLAAYGFSRLTLPGGHFFYLLFIATMMIPLPGSFIPLYVLLVKLGLANTRVGYILPLISGGLPATIFILKGFFEQVPRELEDAARIDGCSRWRVYSRIVLPLARPALATVAIFNGLSCWNDYLLALVILASAKLMPVQLGLMVFQGQYFTQYEMLMAGTVIATVPVILFYLLMQRHFVSGLIAGALKG